MQRRTRPHGHAPSSCSRYTRVLPAGGRLLFTWLTTCAASQLSGIFAEELNTVTLKMRVIPVAVRNRRRILVRRGSDGHGTMSIHALIRQHDDNSDPAGLGLFDTRGCGYCSPRSMPWMAQLDKLHQRLSSPELA